MRTVRLQRGNVVKLWKKRYFAVSDGVLYLLASETEREFSDCIALKDTQVRVPLDPEREVGKKMAFQVSMPSPSVMDGLGLCPCRPALAPRSRPPLVFPFC